jgi:YspA, cpYpsA-related SLOG family
LRFIICGGRGYADARSLFKALDVLHAKVGVSLLIHGDAKGADRLAEQWAKKRGVPYRAFPAYWKRDGERRAGPLRNQRMLDEGKAEGVVAFPGGTGTADMVARALRAGLEVWRPYDEEQ